MVYATNHDATAAGGIAIEGPVLVELTVNGQPRTAHAEPRTLLSDFLRHALGLTGTHVGCEHGACGACTILLDGEAVRSCLLFAVQVQAAEITTVEGLAGEGLQSGDVELHPLQEAFRAHHALQCGFCTPGFLMSLVPFLESVRGQDELSDAAIRDALSGNLCRCTGYQHIVDAVRDAHQRLRHQTRQESCE